MVVKAAGTLALLAVGVAIAFGLYQGWWWPIFYSWSAVHEDDILVAAGVGVISAALLILWIAHSLGKLKFRFSFQTLMNVSIIWIGFGAGLFGPAAYNFVLDLGYNVIWVRETHVIGVISAALLILWIAHSLGKLKFRFSFQTLMNVSIIWIGFGAGLFGPAAVTQLLEDNAAIDSLADSAPTEKITLKCLDSGLVSQSVLSRNLSEIHDACDEELQDALQPELSIAESRLILAMVVAHRFLPYGGSTATEWEDLISEEQLDCDNYVALMYHFLGAELRPGIRFVGFEGGAVGNHAQIFYVGSDIARPMILDPTVSAFTFQSLDELLMGQKPANGVFMVNQRIVTEPFLNRFYSKVGDALTDGLYRPSDLLYFYWDFEGFANSVPLPTPGGERLCKRGEGFEAYCS